MRTVRIIATGLALAISISGWQGVGPSPIAAGGVADLGKPTDAVSPLAAFPLDSFHRIGPPLRSGGKPEIIFLGTQLPYDGGSARERWPVLKALEQFGTLSGVNAVPHPCFMDSFTHQDVCYLPTFDWSHAVYHSRYVAFTHKDLATANDRTVRLYQRMSSTERALYYKYARSGCPPPRKCDRDRIYASIIPAGFSARGSHVLPLVVAGGYVQTVSQIIIDGDFQDTQPIQPGNPTSGSTFHYLPFDTIHAALARGQDPPQTMLVQDVNAEANIITALLCHADGKKPASVCGRPAIRSIMRHVK